MILDAEMLQMIAAFLEPLEIDDEAVEAIREVGPGSHFFQASHTLARYEHAFYTPLLSDWRNFETWSEDGAKDATMRANRTWKALLAAYEPPPWTRRSPRRSTPSSPNARRRAAPRAEPGCRHRRRTPFVGWGSAA